MLLLGAGNSFLRRFFRCSDTAFVFRRGGGDSSFRAALARI